MISWIWRKLETRRAAKREADLGSVGLITGSHDAWRQNPANQWDDFDPRCPSALAVTGRVPTSD
jgi:hypothetical protein